MNKIQILILGAAAGAVIAILLHPGFQEILIVAAILWVLAGLAPAWFAKRRGAAPQN